MTFPIIEMVDSIDVIELDKDLVKHLNEHDQKGLINVIQADALKFDFSSLEKKKKIRLIGNLPYHISTPLLFHLLEFSEIFHDFHVMVQKEVALRLSAEEKTKHYGRISVLIQVVADVRIKFDVAPENFFPKPKVYSSIIEIIPKKKIKRCI